MHLLFAETPYRIEDGRVEPFWLGPNDEGWVAEALEAVMQARGRSEDDAEAIVRPALARLARRIALPPRVPFALWALERRRWALVVDAPVAPAAVREVVFELAASRPHDEALSLAAARLRMPKEAIVPSLFADRRGRRVLTPPDARETPSDAIARYNLAVAQALVSRSMEIDAFVRDDVERVVLAAKRLGLVAWFSREGEAVRLSLSGPLALFHETTKYGRLLARFLPALASAPAWSLRANVVLGETSAWLDLDDAGPLGGIAAMPGDVESTAVRRIARALRRGRHPWRVEEAGIVHVEGAMLAPDFALASDAGRVLVELVPFATPEHVARAVELARRAGGRLLLCVDARFAPPEPLPFLVRYRGAPDAFDLALAADRITGRVWPSPPPCPS